MTSLRRQLTLRMLTVLVLVLGAGMIGIYVAVRSELLHAFDANLRARALALSALVEQQADGRVQMDSTDVPMRDYGVTGPRNYYELRDSAGAVLARSPSLQGHELAGGGSASRVVFRGFDLALPNGRPGRALSLRFQAQAEPQVPIKSAQELRLTVASDRGELNESLGGLLAGVVVCGLLLLAVVSYAVPRVLKHGLIPLERLSEQVDGIDAGSLTERLDVSALPLELQPVVTRLNDLLARLESSFERERRFSADLAHELRTPVAELRSLAECTIKWPERRDPAADQDTLAIALQMEGLVGRLLELARSEHGELKARCEPVDLDLAVAEAWRPFAMRAANRGLRASLAVESMSVEADPVLLRSILGNLFDNAVTYAPDGTTIEVSSATNGLMVSNDAPDLDAADAGRLFDRLWRKEAARSTGEHSGLGLNLSRAFCAAMGWSIDAVLERGRLTLRLQQTAGRSDSLASR